jgi:LCP family protein required for cell wall assembly
MTKQIKLKKGITKRFIGLILLILTIIISIIAIINIKKLDILPDKYFYMLIGLEVLINVIIGLFLLKLKKLVWFILGIILVIILNISNILIANYTHKTNKFINKTFTEYMTISTDYVVVTSKNNSIDSVDKIESNQNINYSKYSRDVELALKKLKQFTYISTDSISHVLNDMDNNPNTYLLISKADYDYMFESTISYNKDNYKVIEEFTVERQVEVNREVKTSYTIYLNGTDFSGVMRDFNLLITINTKTKKILTTSILRGYYIDVPAYNTKDTLMCLGAYDSNVSKEAIEKLLDTKIDYVVNVNTNSLVDIVDTIGGVEFCTDYEFTTTHILTTETYNDKYGQKLYVAKGCREYSGIEALAIARERLHLRNNERGRIENCQKIISGIIKKSLNTTTLLNFDEVLNSYSGLYTTDMNRNVITKLMKSYISDYDKYEITSINLDGTDGTALGHLGSVEVGVTFPDENQVKEASQKIKEVLEGK